LKKDCYLPVKIAGLEFKNPFYVASGPTTRTVEQLKRIEKAGWAAASIKLTIDPAPYINRFPRYAVFDQYSALAFTAEKRLKFREGLQLVQDAKKELTDLLLMANITYAGDEGVSGWVNMAKKFEEVGADIIELNMCCPNMSYNAQLTAGDENASQKKTGASLGKNAEAVTEIVSSIKKAISIPLFVKLTPEGGNIAEIAKALFYAGADVVGGTGNRLGVPPIDIENPGKAVYHLQEEVSMSCFCGSWLKPLAQRDTYEMRKVCGKDVTISAAGGVRTAKDAIEMAMCGADLIGICTETLMSGYDFIGDVVTDTRGWLTEHGHRSLHDVRDVLTPQFHSAPELTIYRGYAKMKDSSLSAPCKVACPAGVPIQTLMKKVSEGKYEEACETLSKVGPLQELCGYLCDAPCEKGCVKGRQTVNLAIREMEKFVAVKSREKGINQNIQNAECNGKNIAVTSGGASGITCAFELLKAGYNVTIYDKEKDIFNTLSTERLPDAVFKGATEVLNALGAKFDNSDTDINVLSSLYDAVYAPAKLSVGDCGVDGAISALDCLASVKVSGNAVIIGRGFLAAEAARAVVANGGKAVVLSTCNTNSEFHMVLENQGVPVISGVSDIVKGNGKILFKQNKTQAELSLDYDMVINATETFTTEYVSNNVYSDKTPFLSAAKLIAAGKAAAAAIDQNIFGEKAVLKPFIRPSVVKAQNVLSRSQYHLNEKPVYLKAGHQEIYTDTEATAESSRCLRCGCGEGCDVCHKICCEFAISLGNQSEIVINPEKCVACGMCYNLCPNQNIEMYNTGEVI